MDKVYCLFLDTEYTDFENHYFTELLGIFTTIEKAQEAKEHWLKDIKDEHFDKAYDEWNIYIINWSTDKLYGYEEVE